jgi:uncharacterized lipoprotein YbaY
MKFSSLFGLLAGVLLLAGCANLETEREGSPDRVLQGFVAAKTPLPAGAQVLVRILDASPRETSRNPASELVADRARPLPADRIVAEWSQALAAGTSEPVPFRLAYTATDAELRHGLNLEARISYGGGLRHRTINARVLTLASAPYPQTLEVEPVR